MQYSTILLSAFAFAGALAAPTNHGSGKHNQVDKSFKIRFEPSGKEFSYRHFDPTVDRTADLTRFSKVLDGTNAVQLTLGSGFLPPLNGTRCRITDSEGLDIVMLRGENVDTQFSQGKPWTFREGAATGLAKLSCGPSEKKTDQTTIHNVNVTLSGGHKYADETIVFDSTRLPDRKAPAHAPRLADSISLKNGLDVDRDLRCQAFDKHHKVIIVERAGKAASSFGDGGKGPWSFPNGPAEVSVVLCDPALKKDDASDKVKGSTMTTTSEEPASEPASEPSSEGDDFEATN